MFSKAKKSLTFYLPNLVHFSGLAVVFRRLTRSEIPILTYHSIGAPDADAPSCLDLIEMRVATSEFRKQMEYVARHYNTVTLGEVLRSQAGQGTLPPYPCVITFDDGYLDNYENAVPVLEELGLKGTFFIIGRPTAHGEAPWLHAMHEILDTVPPAVCLAAFRKAAPDDFSTGGGTKRELCQLVWNYFRKQDRPTRKRFLDAVRSECAGGPPKVFRFMESHHLRELRDRGFEIGCHSMDHEFMSELSDRELERDIRQCKEILGAILGTPPTLFCYPFGGRGSFDARVIERLKREGFACGCTTTPGINDRSTNPFILYRLGVYPSMSFRQFASRLSGLALEARLRRLYRRLISTGAKGKLNYCF